MNPNQGSPTRKKFLLWSFFTLSSLTVLKFISSNKKTLKSDPVRMLTQDGKLVEIDREFIAKNAKKISTQELQNWIKK